MMRKTENRTSRDSLDDWIDQACEADPLPPFIDEPEPECGPPLSRAECDAARIVLSAWQEPDDFIAATNALCRRCNSEDWFNRPHLKFLHDAYVLAEFVGLIAVDGVRLASSSERWPDGYIKLSGKTHNVEVTSTHGGRKLGEEYRGVQAPTLDPVDNWVERAESIPHYLDQAIGAKSRKSYSSPYWLVVYLNINEYDILQKETEWVIRTIKARYAASFEEISVLWKQQVY
jgi:hypothetical protein